MDWGFVCVDLENCVCERGFLERESQIGVW